ncbi:hypothetical protein [Thaumasiovibrio subtropicus]|uniref:hypothetical protein n=1 Tax=Thaumasiovibrio subtropicus TaxID=1891207 RepID=UPI000B34C954|nr:hypothetical protein [Thaumasiovibrio subtropicus]
MDFEVLIKEKYGFSVFEKRIVHPDGKRGRSTYEIRDRQNQVVACFEHISLVFRHLEDELADTVV